MTPMLKIAYDYGVKVALKELDDNELAHALHNQTEYGSPLAGLAGAGLGAVGGAGLGALAGTGIGALANKLRNHSMFGMSDDEVLAASGTIGGLLGGAVGAPIGGSIGLMHGRNPEYAKHDVQITRKLKALNNDLYETEDPTFYHMLHEDNTPLTEAGSSPEMWRKLLELHNQYKNSR